MRLNHSKLRSLDASYRLTDWFTAIWGAKKSVCGREILSKLLSCEIDNDEEKLIAANSLVTILFNSKVKCLRYALYTRKYAFEDDTVKNIISGSNNDAYWHAHKVALSAAERDTDHNSYCERMLDIVNYGISLLDSNQEQEV